MDSKDAIISDLYIKIESQNTNIRKLKEENKKLKEENEKLKYEKKEIEIHEIQDIREVMNKDVLGF